MGRNKYIYALAERALVIDSALASGGTWEGALEDLQQGWVPLYVRSPGEGPGNAALVDKGGIAFPASLDANESLLEFFGRTSTTTEPDKADSQQSLLGEGSIELAPEVPTVVKDLPIERVGHSSSLVAQVPEHDASQLSDPEPEIVPATETDANANADAANVVRALTKTEADSLPSASKMPGSEETLALHKSWDMYDDFLVKAVRLLAMGAQTEDELATALSLEKGQAKAWLKKAVELGDLEKLKKPIRYGTRQQASLC